MTNVKMSKYYVLNTCYLASKYEPYRYMQFSRGYPPNVRDLAHCTLCIVVLWWAIILFEYAESTVTYANEKGLAKDI